MFKANWPPIENPPPIYLEIPRAGIPIAVLASTLSPWRLITLIPRLTAHGEFWSCEKDLIDNNKIIIKKFERFSIFPN